VWGELFELTASEVPAAPAEAPCADPRPTSSPAPLRIRVDVAGPRAVEVAVQLRRADAASYVVPALRMPGSSGPRLTHATVVHAPDGVLAVDLAVPAALPAGLYDGPIVDEAANCPAGWLTVTIRDPDEP
jgi:hypothetical protein